MRRLKTGTKKKKKKDSQGLTAEAKTDIKSDTETQLKTETVTDVCL